METLLFTFKVETFVVEIKHVVKWHWKWMACLFVLPLSLGGGGLVRCVYFGLGMAWCISLCVLRSWHGCGHVWWAMGLLGSWYGCDGVWWGLNMCMMGWWYGHGGVVKWVWPLVGSWCAYSVPLISWCHESLVLWSHDIGAAVLWIMINEYQVYAVQV